MGGDHAPRSIVEGALAALGQSADLDILLVGQEEALLSQLGHRVPDRLQVVHAPSAIGMGEDPTQALRRKKDASILVASDLVRTGAAEALVSAGPTGALVAAASMQIGRLTGIDRPAIAVPFPTASGWALLLDAGAIMGAKPAYLAQFGLIGSVYAQAVLGIANPQVGLLNVGEEANKGTLALQEAHGLLCQMPGLRFVGNIEGHDVLSGRVDVVVCDGLVGNILLKFAEGVGDWLVHLLTDKVRGNWRQRVGLALLRPSLQHFKSRLDDVEYGGALLLGIDGICVAAHGHSSPQALSKAILLAARSVSTRVVARTKERLALWQETVS